MGLLKIGDTISIHARHAPQKIGARDSKRSLTYQLWNERSCRLANALLGLGLVKGDRVAILAYNCIEWMEIYIAVAKAGLVAVPINFRLLSAEVLYIADNCQARAFIVQHDLIDRVEPIRDDLDLPSQNYIYFGSGTTPNGYKNYEALLTHASASEPNVSVAGDDPWAFMYTSGTTGRPKGAIRSHASMALLAVIIALDHGFTRDDIGLLVMPLCHSNSLWYAATFAYLGATIQIDDRHSFDPEHLLKTFSDASVTFTSLVPTHYIMMLGLSDAIKAKYRTDSVRRLLISSAPARKETKLEILKHFKNTQLLEGYGSTEAGWVTLLRPDEQLSKLGSIGRELTGSGAIKLLDENGEEVTGDGVGEIYSCTPYAFTGYWRLPEKTKEAFRDGYCSVGDMARRDAEGYYFLADRKSNMIISGGENVYPSEVEGLLGEHPKIKDVAVIGVPHEKWGEAVHAVIVLHDDVVADEQEMLDWCRERIAGYKRPRSAAFVGNDDMPRTATGKILHRVLRDRYTST